jgi:hypothetical protein
MYLVDTNVVSENRKRTRANAGVRDFFKRVAADQAPVFLSVVTVGELRRGIELLRHRGDTPQANRLDKWLVHLLRHYEDYILDVDSDIAQLWGRLRVPYHENAIEQTDRCQSAHSRPYGCDHNRDDFWKTGVRVLNPFS